MPLAALAAPPASASIADFRAAGTVPGGAVSVRISTGALMQSGALGEWRSAALPASAASAAGRPPDTDAKSAEVNGAPDQPNAGRKPSRASRRGRGAVNPQGRTARPARKGPPPTQLALMRRQPLVRVEEPGREGRRTRPEVDEHSAQSYFFRHAYLNLFVDILAIYSYT